MSEYAEKHRSDMRDKAKRLTANDPQTKVDASSWTPPPALKADVQTGMRPVSRQNFRTGGKVRGEPAKSHAGRTPRMRGGPLVDDLVNVDMKKANEFRDGEKHDGGLKTGGRARRAAGGHADASDDRKLIHAEMAKHGKDCRCAKCHGGRAARAAGGPLTGGTRPTGGRLARKAGGKAKGAMNVNIIIAQPKSGASVPPPGMAGPPPGIPAPPPQGMPQGQAPMGPGAGAPVPMGRKSGGRTGYPIESGAGGGLGRLEKARAYG